MHRRGRRLKKESHHGSGTSIPVPTGGQSDRIWKIVCTHHTSTPLLKLRDNR